MSHESLPTLQKAMRITEAVVKSESVLSVTADEIERDVSLLSSREQYRAHVLPDFHPVAVRAHKIEDIFSRWLQTLSGADKAALHLDDQTAIQIVEEILTRGEAAVVLDDQDRDQVTRILARWMAESYAVWPGDEARLRAPIKKPVRSVEPLHIIMAHLWPTTASDYGRLLFSLLAADGDGKAQDLKVIKLLRGYLARTERLGLFGDMVYYTFRDSVILPDQPEYEKARGHFSPPYCLPHARQLQSDLGKLLDVYQEDLHRGVLIKWLQNLIAAHLALYYIRMAHAVNDDVRKFFDGLATMRREGSFDEAKAPPIHCHLKCGNDIQQCEYRSRMTIPLWLQERFPPHSARSLGRPSADDDEMYRLALSFILIDRVRDLMRSFYYDEPEKLWQLRDCLDMCELEPAFNEYLQKAALLQAAHYLDLSDIDETHKQEKWNLARQNPAGPLYMLYQFVADDYATVPRRTDRAVANIGKFYRQLARNQDRGFLALRGNDWYYRLHDELLTLMVHLVAARVQGQPTIAQLEEQLEAVYGLQISETRSGTDPNEQALRNRLRALGMYRTVSDAREAQFIEPLFAA